MKDHCGECGREIVDGHCPCLDYDDAVRALNDGNMSAYRTAFDCLQSHKDPHTIIFVNECIARLQKYSEMREDEP